MKKGMEEAILYPLFPGKGFLEKDPENGYRYYTFTQLHIVEAIVLCRDLNIPLSRFRDFIDRPKGTLRYDKLVQEGIEKAEEQIKMLQKKIQFLRLVENGYHRSEYTLHRNHPVSCLFPPLTLWLPPYEGNESGPAFSHILKQSMREIEKAGLKVGLVYGMTHFSKIKQTFFSMELADSPENGKYPDRIYSLPSSWFRSIVRRDSDIRQAPALFPDLFAMNYDKIILESTLFTGEYRYHEPFYEVACLLPSSYSPSPEDDVFPTLFPLK